MYQFYIFIYCLILGLSIHSRNIIAIISVLIVGVLILSLIPIIQKNKKENIRFQIKNNPNTEVLNVNKAAWWELEELPNFSRAKAKHAVMIREKKGRYTSKELFMKLNAVNNIEEISKLISV